LNEAFAREMRGSIGNFFSVFAERSFDKNIANFHRLVQDLVRQRRAESQEDQSKRMDLMSLMLSGADSQTGKQMTDLNIIHQCVTFLIAGHETTSTLLSWAFYFISQNPAVEQTLLDEIDSVFGSDSSSAPTQRQLSKLKYTNYIIKETLRIYPPLAAIEKAFTKQEELEFLDPSTGAARKGLTDPSAASIVINTYSLHRNKLYWGDDAEEFKPERWTPAAVADRAAKNGSANAYAFQLPG
jgi:cytochrome P450 / NADPH-cytochrome P450 reductase